MTAADQIAEINAQFAERVKLLERERDAKVAMVRGRDRSESCQHEPIWISLLSNPSDGYHLSTCKHCLADIKNQPPQKRK